MELISTPILPHKPKRPPKRFLDIFYMKPIAHRSLEDLHRFEHRDVASFSDRDLLMERDAVWLRIILERPADDDWLFDRHSHLLAEQEQRRRSLATVASDNAPTPIQAQAVIVRRN